MTFALVSDTALRDLPHGWKSARLGDINTAVNKSVIPTNFPDETFEYYSIPAFQEFGAPVLTRGTQILSNKNLVENGTVMFGKLNPRVLKVWLVNSTLPHRKIASTEFLPILPNEEAVAEFIYFFCQSSSIVAQANQLVSGSTPSRERVDKKSFYEIWVPLPSLPEQHAIAHALCTVQEALAARQRELTLERERKAALMEHLFTHGTRNEPRKQTEIGEMPESWRVAKLGDLCANERGVIQAGPFGSQLHSSDYKTSGVPVVNPTHLGVNTIVEDRLPFINKPDADRLAKHYLRQGDIIIGRRGDFGRFSYINERYDGWLCGTGSQLIRLENHAVDNYFLSVSFGTPFVQNYLSQNSVGSIMPNLNTKILRGMILALPSLDEQRAIASALRACDAKFAALEREAQVLDELFRAMLDELMTGRLSAVPLIQTD